jgi:hypothetical protein
LGDSPRIDVDQLLEFADWMGMDQEAGELRADIRERESVERIVRICQLAGFPLSKDGSAGIVIRPVREPNPDLQGYFRGAVTVSWQVGPELDEAADNALVDEEPSKLWSTIHSAMETMLAAVLQQGDCSTVIDSLQGDLIVRGAAQHEHVSPLYRTPAVEEPPTV